MVERQYGVLKRRFPALAIGIRLDLKNAINVIIACCVLHNMCILRNEEEPVNENIVLNIEELISNGQITNFTTNITSQNAYGLRRTQITNYFDNL